MGMQTYIVGFIPPDEKFNKMLLAYQSCKDANIPIPKEIYLFFNGAEPDMSGVKIYLSSESKYKECIVEWQDDSREGYQIYLDKLPKDIKIIRFVNSY